MVTDTDIARAEQDYQVALDAWIRSQAEADRLARTPVGG